MATDTQAQAPDLTPTLLGELAHLRLVSQALLAEDRSDILQVIVGNFDRRELLLIDAVGPRHKRLIVSRPGYGGQTPVGNGVASEILEQNEGRMGGLIVNSGAFPVRLYLATLGDIAVPSTGALTGQAPNRPSTWLGANGGAFDFRLGNVLYGGTVCAAGIGGASQLDWSEF